jgi:hypothetical protein
MDQSKIDSGVEDEHRQKEERKCTYKRVCWWKQIQHMGWQWLDIFFLGQLIFDPCLLQYTFYTQKNRGEISWKALGISC